MSTRWGPIERVIFAEIERLKNPPNPALGATPVLVSSWEVVSGYYRPQVDLSSAGWSPTLAQQKTVVRAMHSFVFKHPQYALAGGNGRKRLYLYEPADRMSALRARLAAERRGPVEFMEIRQIVATEGDDETRNALAANRKAPMRISADYRAVERRGNGLFVRNVPVETEERWWRHGRGKLLALKTRLDLGLSHYAVLHQCRCGGWFIGHAHSYECSACRKKVALDRTRQYNRR
jgi:hypothetical protein